MIECLRGVIGKAANLRVSFLVAEPSRNQFEVVLEVEVFGFFINHLLIASDTSDCHLDSDHHVEDKIPVIIAKEHHIPFCFLPFVNMNIANCLFSGGFHLFDEKLLVQFFKGFLGFINQVF